MYVYICSSVCIQGKTALDSLLEFHRRSVDELNADEAVRVKDIENLLRTKMHSGMTGAETYFCY